MKLHATFSVREAEEYIKGAGSYDSVTVELPTPPPMHFTGEQFHRALRKGLAACYDNQGPNKIAGIKAFRNSFRGDTNEGPSIGLVDSKVIIEAAMELVDREVRNERLRHQAAEY